MAAPTAETGLETQMGRERLSPMFFLFFFFFFDYLPTDYDNNGGSRVATETTGIGTTTPVTSTRAATTTTEHWQEGQRGGRQWVRETTPPSPTRVFFLFIFLTLLSIDR